MGCETGGAGETEDEARPPSGKDPVFPELGLEVNELVIGLSFIYSFTHVITEHPQQTINLVVPNEPLPPSLCHHPILILGLALYLAWAKLT